MLTGVPRAVMETSIASTHDPIPRLISLMQTTPKTIQTTAEVETNVASDVMNVIWIDPGLGHHRSGGFLNSGSVDWVYLVEWKMARKGWHCFYKSPIHGDGGVLEGPNGW